MRKKNKRLALHRETLRNLDESNLQAVVGGSNTYCAEACGTTCRCLDNLDTFSADCTAGCPFTSQG